MPRKPKQPAIRAAHFVWRLFRRSGVYYADGRSTNLDLGKHSLGTRDHAEALRRLKRLDECKAIELGLIAQPMEADCAEISISAGWKTYLDFAGRSDVLGGVSARSLKRYRAIRDKHEKYCRKHGIETWIGFDKAAIEKYSAHLSRKYAYRTVYCELTMLKSVNKWLIGEKLLPPTAKLKCQLRKPQGTDTYCYTSGEVSRMVSQCLSKPKLMWLGNVILMLAHTGMRISELAGLRWSDVDLGKGFIRIADERSSHRKKQTGSMRTTKGRRSRIIPIHPCIHDVLASLPRGADGRVLHAERGGPLLPENVLQALIHHVIAKLKDEFPTPEGEIGFEHGRLHSFRHFFCSQAFLNGASEGEIREWLGHADSKMVEYYRHLRQEDAMRRMQQINFLPPGDLPNPRQTA